MLTVIRRTSDKIAEIMAYLSGAAFLLLSFYITADVLGRYTGTFNSRVSDDISSYVLAFGGTWALAYALRVDAHIRIDIVINFLSERAREILLIVLAATTALLAGLLAIYGWELAYESYDIGIRSISILQTPLFIPQAAVAFGFTMLLVQAVLMLVSCLLARLHCKPV